MPPKAKIAAPIDRPLSRAYLREFGGWSTAYPPGVSEPNTLRRMRNMMVNRDGSVRVRPGLRYLTYAASGTNGMAPDMQLRGSHEVFFTNDGDKAYLVAVYDSASNDVRFRAWVATGLEAQPYRQISLQSCGFTDPDGTPLSTNTPQPFTAATTYVRFLQIDNKIIALSNNGETARVLYVGATKTAVTPQSITRPFFGAGDKPRVIHPTKVVLDDSDQSQGLVNVSARSSKTLRLQSTDIENAEYQVGYFYTYSNEFGESAPSAVTVVKVRRPWPAWRLEEATAGATNEPNGTEVTDADLASDQLWIYPGRDGFVVARNAGAISFNVYAIYWSNQDPVPVEGQLIGSYDISDYNASVFDADSIAVRHTPQPYDQSRSMLVPSQFNRVNYSTPPRGGNGIVAGDRMVIVYDPTNPAQIRWTTNQLGEYLNFSAHRGGGYKTLTYGNLYVPSAVLLWQNPQSADTLTILCLGVDGKSASFYMAPAQVASQSDATNIFGFEETTATPGTVSPYGNEVLNNSLFHPTDEALVKSTASNYNINHKTQTDLIENQWKALRDKQHIVSAYHDNRLYLLVYNPSGVALPAGCWGNEVWVLDTAAKNGSWSRWQTPGISLKKVEVNGKVMMGLMKPEGIFAFDEDYTADDVVATVSGNRVVTPGKPIYWEMETNTQGANRAHDAWAHLQQASVVLGNFQGQLRYGVRGFDLNGRVVEKSKIVRDQGDADQLPWDIEDYLLIRRDMKEWRFFASSVPLALDDQDVHPSSGQINLVQYRYTPVSVNVGYEYGSIETFEYGRAAVDDSAVVNGVPRPMVDYGRP